MKSVSITSGKGGVGKSNLALNLGIALADRSKKVLLFDADLGLANLDILLGITCEHSLADVVDGKLALPDIVIDGPRGLRVLPASSGILKLERLPPGQRVRLVTELRDLSRNFDLVLFDTGAGLTENVLFFNAAADEVLLVTTPDPTALTDAYALIKVLSTTHHVNSVALLVNQTTMVNEGSEIHRKLSKVCARFLDREIAYLGSVPKDSDVERAVREREPLIISRPRSPAGSAISKLAERFDEVFTSPPRATETELWSALAAARMGSTSNV